MGSHAGQHSPASSRMHDSLARLLAKRRLEILPVVLGEEISSYRLPTILVYTLKDFVARRIAQTRKQRKELADCGSASRIFEDNLVQLSGARNLIVPNLFQHSKSMSMGFRRCGLENPFTLV